MINTTQQNHVLVILCFVSLLVHCSSARLVLQQGSGDVSQSSNPTTGIQQFRQCTSAVNQLASTVTFPDNQNFSDVAYHVWNTAYNTTRVPVAVAQPLDSAQVAALVRCANTANLRMVIRGGGHSYEAMSLINRGIIIDLSKMRQLELLEPSHTDSTAGTGASTADTRRLLVGAGMRLGPVYAYLFQHKLTMEGPTCPTVGVSGATLGGGTGHSTRRLGLLADQVRAAEVVTMSGEVLHVNATSHPDLFWAIRGGGANYAIVTNWEFAVVPAPSNITYASLWWDPTAANLAAVLKAFTAWRPWLLQEEVARVHIGMFSDKVMLEAWLWDSPGNTTASQQAAVKIMGSFLSITPDLPRPREQLLLTRSFERYMLSQSVTDCYGVPEWAWGWANISTIEAADAAEQSWRKGGSAVFVDTVPPEVWDQFAPLLMSRVTNTATFTRAVLIGAGGHQRLLPNNHTGFGFRNMKMQVEIGTEAVSPADTQWAQQTLGALLPASRGRLFWNHFQCLDNSTDPEWSWKSYFGEHARQLLAVKKIWDPQGRINAMNCSALN